MSNVQFQFMFVLRVNIMDSDFIFRCLHALPNVHQVDVIARDQLSKFRLQGFPAAIVVNTDKSSESGTHWTAFYIVLRPVGPLGVFFDSHGYTSQDYKFKPPFPVLNFQDAKCLQLENTDTCGLWCFTFLQCMAVTQKPRSIYSLFGSDYYANERRMWENLRNLIPIGRISPFKKPVKMTCRKKK